MKETVFGILKDDPTIFSTLPISGMTRGRWMGSMLPTISILSRMISLFQGSRTPVFRHPPTSEI